MDDGEKKHRNRNNKKKLKYDFLRDIEYVSLPRLFIILNNIKK